MQGWGALEIGRKSLVLGKIQRLIVEATSKWVGTRIESDEGVFF